jgi:hypothetical protein
VCLGLSLRHTAHKGAPLTTETTGGGYGRSQHDQTCAGTNGARKGDMRISGTGAGEPAGHRLEPSYFLFPAPEGGETTRLGGELRREEQLLPRAGMSTDRDETDDDVSEAVVHLPFHPSSGTTDVAQEPRLGTFASTSSS